MGGTWKSALCSVTWSSLAFSGKEYVDPGDGTRIYRGLRPGPGWHAHGTFSRRIGVLVKGAVKCVVVAKQRWLEVATGRTRHDRPPDDLPWRHYCSLIIAMKLWGWLDGGRGLHNAPEVVENLYGTVHPRTQQRWLARALPHAMRLQQAIRLAVIERSEPRPVETLFPGGLSPPETVMRRSWRSPPALDKLWRALAFLMGGALRLQIPAAVLLAEARGRWDETRNSQTP